MRLGGGCVWLGPREMPPGAGLESAARPLCCTLRCVACAHQPSVHLLLGGAGVAGRRCLSREPALERKLEKCTAPLARSPSRLPETDLLPFFALPRALQALQAYGLFKIGEMVGRRSIVGYSVTEPEFDEEH